MAQLSTRRATILGRSAAALAVALWVCFFELGIYFDHARPHVLDAAAGRVYALNNHGSIAYLTRGENYLLRGLEWGGMGFISVAALFQYLMRRANVPEQR